MAMPNVDIEGFAARAEFVTTSIIDEFDDIASQLFDAMPASLGALKRKLGAYPNFKVWFREVIRLSFDGEWKTTIVTLKEALTMDFATLDEVECAFGDLKVAWYENLDVEWTRTDGEIEIRVTVAANAE